MSARNRRRGKDDRRRRRDQARARRHQARGDGAGAGGVEVVFMDAAGRERAELWPADHPLLEQMRHDCAICRADQAGEG